MTIFSERRFSSFTFLNATQFLAALNDNIYKLLVIFFCIQLEGMENSHKILATTGAIFVLPFLLFSASAGILADRFSKRNIIILTKTLEFITLAISVSAFYYESKLAAYFILFLMATYSAIFAPSKYSILPELVSSDKISKSNGLMTSFTFLAIILGTFTASFLLEISGRNYVFVGLFSTFLGFIAMVASFCIEETPPAGSSKRFNIFFLGEIASTLKQAASYPSLLTAMFGSAFFLFLGAFVQLNAIPFAVESLNLTDVQGGYLFLLTAVGIGTGAMIAGKISGATIELGLVPLAGLGVAICSYFMDYYAHDLVAVIPLIILLGLFGGIYQIPLDSYVQVASPKTSRGQMIAATNFLSFFGVLCASGLLYLNSHVFGLSSGEGFIVMGTITIIVTVLISFQYFDYLTRFIGMILSWLHFKTTIHGLENISDEPAIYICKHTAWNDTLLMLGSQRLRMRFFIEHEQDHSHSWIKKIYRMLRVVMVTSIEPLENNLECIASIKNALKKRISVCIFVDKDNIGEEIKKLNQSYSFNKVCDEVGCPIIAVTLQKGEKEKSSPIFTRLWNKLRVPAEITFV